VNSTPNVALLLGYPRQWACGDLMGGLVTAIVAVPHCLPLGVIAFAPLGPEYSGLGAAAGLVSSIVAGIVAALFGSSRILFGGPRVSSALLMAATLSVLLADPALRGPAGPDVPRILALLAFYVVLAGAPKVARP
jgi:MFS superfamily sulfate permease-like transporter